MRNMFVTMSDVAIDLDCIDFQHLSEQINTLPDHIKIWLENSNPTGLNPRKCYAVYDPKGQLVRVVYVYDSNDKFWACASLFDQIPADYVYRLPTNLSQEVQVDLMITWAMAAYSFRTYKTTEVESQPRLSLDLNQQTLYQQAAEPLIESIYLTRNLINMPCEELTPSQLARHSQHLADEMGARCEIVSDIETIRTDFPLVHAVGRASKNQPQVIKITWGDPSHYKLGLVGKGVCYDTGGLNLKPGQSMLGMKKDMGGAALVLGIAYLIMKQKLPIYLQVVIPAVENSLGSESYRPGDVFYSRKGLSVHIGNTDAEGRLILADALSLIQDDGPLDLLVDFATLTGAQRVALGPDIPGFFSTDSQISQQLMKSSETTVDPVWELPLYTGYKDYLKHDIADINNIGSIGLGGSILAALFLQRFVNKDQPWVHVDFNASNHKNMPARPKGGEAQSLRAWDHLLKQCSL